MLLNKLDWQTHCEILSDFEEMKNYAKKTLFLGKKKLCDNIWNDGFKTDIVFSEN